MIELKAGDKIFYGSHMWDDGQPSILNIMGLVVDHSNIPTYFDDDQRARIEKSLNYLESVQVKDDLRVLVWWSDGEITYENKEKSPNYQLIESSKEELALVLKYGISV